MSRATVVRVVAVGLVFALGVLSGVALSGLWLVHRLRNPRPPAETVSRLVALELRLDRNQRAALEEIVEDGWRRLEAARDRVRPDVEAAVAEAASTLRPLLRPDQVERLDRMLERRKERQRLLTGPGSG